MFVCYNGDSLAEGEVQMITLTGPAAAQLQRLLQEKEPSEQGVRIFVHAGGCAGLQYGMAFEGEGRESDIILESQGVRLYVDPFSATYLEGACIDYEDSPAGAGFRVENPNAATTCACGLSFRVEPGGEAVI
jgi:iron-sulfur cluster assembly protein